RTAWCRWRRAAKGWSFRTCAWRSCGARMWDNPRQLNALAFAVALLALMLLCWGAAAWAVRQPIFEVRQVAIAGPLSRVNPAHLEAVVREELRGTFFTMQLAEARSSLQRVPWVRGIALRRQWPNRLEVTVTEHTPLARWNDIALGRSDSEERLNRFVAYYARTVGALARAGTRVEYADLRYRNGFAARVPGFKERAVKKAA